MIHTETQDAIKLDQIEKIVDDYKKEAQNTQSLSKVLLAGQTAMAKITAIIER